MKSNSGMPDHFEGLLKRVSSTKKRETLMIGGGSGTHDRQFGCTKGHRSKLYVHTAFYLFFTLLFFDL